MPTKLGSSPFDKINGKLAKFMDEKVYGNCSPDIAELTMCYDFVPLFIYGTEKLGFSDQDLVQNMPRYGIGKTSSKMYSLHLTEMNYPVMLNEADVDHTAAVLGEVYLVTPSVLKGFDTAYQNHRMFRRVRRSVVFYPPEDFGKKEKKNTWGMAWMYIGCPEIWIPKRAKGELKLMPLFAKQGSETETFRVFSYQDDEINRSESAYDTTGLLPC